jgi:transposase InsO family protein
VKGKGTVFVAHRVERDGRHVNVVSRLYPVYYIPGISQRLLSLGEFLQQGYFMTGDKNIIALFAPKQNNISMALHPHMPGQTIYWLKAQVAPAASLLTMSTIFLVDYDLMHRRLGHPSKDVLRQASGNTRNFPKRIIFPIETPICRGCAEGKMPSQSFPPTTSRASKPFEKVHSDLKSLPVESYHRFKYFVTFYDDYTSMGWIMCLRAKSDTLTAIKQFFALVKTQHNAHIKEFMTDAGGEYKSLEVEKLLKDLGIKTLQSVPHMHQQNGRAERFNRTIMEKAQAMRLDACLPQSWWEFAVLHALHCYNRTPMRRLKW